MTALATIDRAEIVEPIEELLDRAGDYLRASRAPGTLRAYESDLRIWSEWCEGRGLDPFPAEPLHICAFLADQAEEVTPGTLSGRLSALRWAHEQRGQQSPTTHPQVRAVLSGIKRSSDDQPRQVRPLYLEDIKAMVEALSDDTRDLRDRALLLAGWWMASRRSELSALRASDLTDDPRGLVVKLRRSKTDQEGKGRLVPVAYVHADESLCPVRAVRRWMTDAGISEGPVFRPVDRWGNPGDRRLSPEAVAVAVKERAEAIGIDPATVSGHSLRAGFVSECDRRGVPDSAVMRVTGHRTVAMLDTYTRPRALFDGAAASFFDEVKARDDQFSEAS